MKSFSGTSMVKGIEYIEYPPAASLVKAMKKEWADKLESTGAIRLSAIQYYQELESSELGDINEGKGMSRVNGHEMNTGSVNQLYIWCAALPDTDLNVLTKLDGNYNSSINISDTEQFLIRICNAAKEKGYRFMAQAGSVQYDRGAEISKIELNSKSFQHNAFQKDSSFEHQNEFRIVFTNVGEDNTENQFIDLEIGKCSEIVKVTEHNN